MRKHLLSLAIVMLALALLLTTAVGAAPANQATVIAIQDTYINRASPGSTYDNGLLFLQQNLTSFETDKVALIKFDLSAVSFPITK